MASRRRARQRALQILFIWDARKQPVEDAIDSYYDALYSEEELERDPFVTDLVRGTVEHVAEIDARITLHAPVVYEMTRGGTPAPVTIDEALELARKFSGEESVQFVNGVLDAVRRE